MNRRKYRKLMREMACKTLEDARDSARLPEPAPRDLVLFELAPQDFNLSLCHLDGLIEQSARPVAVVLYMRVSAREQKRRQNLQNRLSELRQQAASLGLRVVGEFSEIADSRSLDGDERARFRQSWRRVRRYERKNPETTVALLTDTRDRYLRGSHFRGLSYPELEPPTEAQWESLRWLAGDVMFATVQPPESTSASNHSCAIKTGQKFKSKGGRPRKRLPGEKRRLRDQLMPRAIELRQQGESIRAISRRLNVPPSTIADWLK